MNNLQSMIRDVFPTTSGVSITELEMVTDVLIDNRAIGYRANAVGGREASFEPIAELIVTHNLEMELASALMDGELMVSVFAALFPKKESLKITASQGMITMPMIVSKFRGALPGDGAAKTALSQILAELFANSIRHLSLVLPFDGLVELSAHDSLFPTADVIMNAARVKRITDVLESMRLDPEIGRVKTLSAAALYSALQPMFVRAGRLLLQTIDQDQQLQDTLLLLRDFVTNNPEMPKFLVNNDDLRNLATNLTFVLAALSQPSRELFLPEHALKTAISESALRLRELKRFSVKHISELKQWYVHYCIYDNPGQRVVGLLFGRNLALENRPQVTIFNQVDSANSPMWTQTPFPAAENRIEPLLVQLFNTELKCQGMAALAAGVATYLSPDREAPANVIYCNGATDIELLHYAAALCGRVLLSKSQSVDYTGWGLYFMNEDTELNYDTQSLLLGTRVLSADPAEAVIHSGFRENLGDGAVPSRIQAIPDTSRHQLLLSNPNTFTVGLGNPIDIKINLDDVTLSASTSLSDLLYLPKQVRLSLTKNLATASVLRAYFDVMLALAARAAEDSTGDIARLRAATALSNLILSVGASPAGRAMTRTVLVKLIKSVEAVDREKVRGKLRHAVIAYKIAAITGANILVAMDLIDAEQSHAAIDLIQTTGLEQFMVGSVPNLSDLV